MAGGTLTQFVFGALGPVLTTDLDLGPFGLGSLVSTYFLVGAACSPLLGRLTDRAGGRRALRWTFTLGAVSLVGLGASPSMLFVIVATITGGLAGALANPATNLLIVSHVPRGEQGMVTGAKQSGVPVAALIAGSTLPPLATVLGWRVALVLCGAVVLLALGLSERLIGRDPPLVLERRHSEHVRIGTTVWWLAAYSLFMGSGVSAVITYVPLYAFAVLGLSAASAGTLTAVFGVTSIVARLLWGRVAEHHLRASSVLVVLATSGLVAQLALAGAQFIGPWSLWASVAAFGATAGGWMAVVMLVIIRDVPPQASGQASGRVILAFYTGLMVSPLPFGWSVERLDSYIVGWLAVAAMFAAASACSMLWHRRAKVASQ